MISLSCSRRIEDQNAGEVLFIVGDQYTIVHLCYCGDDHIEIASGFPGRAPPDIGRAQARAARSSNGKTRPLKSDYGPSGPANHASSWSRFLPLGFSRMPHRHPHQIEI
jgi:hypothetical protein